MDTATKTFEKAVPIHLKQYVEKYGRPATAGKLGRSQTCIAKWLNTNECTVEAELCCELLLKAERSSTKLNVAIITGSKETLNAVKALVEANGTFQFVQ